jgi:hypothetical protein
MIHVAKPASHAAFSRRFDDAGDGMELARQVCGIA